MVTRTTGRGALRSLAILVAVGVAGSTGCGDNQTSELTVDMNHVEMPVGDTVSVALALHGGGQLTTPLVWKIDDPTIADAAATTTTLAISGRALGQTHARTTYAGREVAVAITVDAAALGGLTAAAGSVTIPVGTVRPFQLIANYTDGTHVDVTDMATYAIDDPAILTISNRVLHADRVGRTLITASYGSQTAVFSVTVTAAVAVDLVVEPPSAKIPVGAGTSLVATALMSDGSLLDMTDQATWTSDDGTIAGVAGGRVTGVAIGATQVHATVGAITAASAITVSSATVTGLVVSPSAPTIPAGYLQAMRAIAQLSDGSTLDVTDQCTWSSLDTSIATIDAQGVMHGVATGTVQISAAFGGLQAATEATVSSAMLLRIDVTPAPIALAAGTTAHATATGIFSDGTTRDITTDATWASGQPAIATVSAGVVSGLAAGTAQITASQAGVVGTATAVVSSAQLISLALSAPVSSLPVGTSTQLTAVGTYSDGTTQDVTLSALWRSASSTHVTVGRTGGHVVATAVGVGPETITATVGSITASILLTATAATLTRLEIDPPSLSLPVGTSRAANATAVYSDGTTADVTTRALWASSDQTIATVSNGPQAIGSVLGRATGSATITAQLDGATASLTVQVTSAVVVSIQVAPASLTLPAGTSDPLIATAAYSDGSSADVTGQVVWSSSAIAIATVSNATGAQGQVTGRAAGSATITATLGAVSSTAAVTVTAATLTEIQLTPAAVSLPAGTATTLVATGVYSDGTTRDVTAQATWTSDTPAVAGVVAGRVSAVAPGSATISVQLGTINVVAAVTVTSAVQTGVAVNPPQAGLVVGQTSQLTATAGYSDGSTADVTAQGTWSSSDPQIASVSNTAGTRGRVTAAAPGSATITVQVGGQSATMQVTVSAAMLTALQLTPVTASLPSGQSTQLTATGTYDDATTHDLTTQATWTSSAPAVATVSSTGAVAAHATGSATIQAQVGGITATATITVTAATLQQLQVAPASLTVPAGVSSQLTATGIYSDGSHVDVTATATWTSSATSVATVSNVAGTAGQVTGHATGSATITAQLGGLSQTAAVTVTAAQLTQIQLTPTAVSLPVGTTATLVATGVYSDGTSHDITAQVAWTSDTTSVASVSGGTITAVATGSATISAALAGVTTTAAVTVTAAQLTQIQLTPASLSLPAGTSASLVATGVYSDGATHDVTAQVAWTSDTPSVATVSAGTVTAVASGSATISARLSGLTATAAATVTTAQLSGLTITPPQPTIAAGQAIQLTATASYSDGSTATVTGQVTWTSSAQAVATVSNASGSAGQATGAAPGTTTITAQLGSAAASVTLTVSSAVLTGLAVTPSQATVAAGLSTQLTATGSYSNGSTADLSTQVTWTSSAPAVASVSASGAVSSSSPGTATITAQLSGSTASAAVTVTAATLQQLQVSPATVSIPLGLTSQLTATAIYSDGSHIDATAQVTWTSSATAVATVSNVAGSAGQVASQATGSATITAAFGGATATAAVTITSAQLTQIQLTPSTLSLPAGATGSLAATGVYSDGSNHDITSQVSWTSSASSVASVTGGTVTGVTAGSATITAVLGSASATAAVTVTAATLVSLAIDPPHPSTTAGQSVQLTATGTYTDGATVDVTSQVLWTTSDSSVATVSNASGSRGQATGAGAGSATITAALGSASAGVALTVSQATLTSIAINPAVVTLPAGLTSQLAVIGTYSDGSTADVSAQVAWLTDDPSVATVSSTGLVSGVSAGGVTVTAQLGQLSADAEVNVSSASLQQLQVSPATLGLALGLTGQLTATAIYSDGTHADATASVTWTSSATAIATVSNAAGSVGQVAAQALGSATITATFGAATASAAVTVTAATLQQLQVAPATVSLPLGLSSQLTATGIYSDGTHADVTASATWTSGAQAVATVSNAAGSAGLVASQATGDATITAAIGGVTATTAVTVTAAQLTQIQLTPASLSLPAGASASLVATGVYSDGSHHDITSQATWSSSDPSTAGVSGGSVTASATGSATVVATLGGVSASAAVTVTAAVLASISITPPQPTVAAGQSTQLTATGTYSDGTTVNLTTQVTWTSSDTTVATVSNASGSQGRATAVATGTATITAQSGGASATASFTASSAVLTGLAIAPGTLSLPSGLSGQLTATATYSDGSTADLSSQATWSSSATSTASVSTTGAVSAGATGTATITAQVGSTTATATVTVTAAALQQLQISPSTPSLPLGLTTQLTATAIYSDGTHADATASATWTSSATAVATVSSAAGSAGQVASQTTGTATITAQVGSTTATATVTVTAATLSQIQLTPSAPTVPAGTSQAMVATGVYSDGTTHDLTSQVSWTSSATSVATVTSTGTVAAVAAGSATISAQLGSVTTTATVTVTAATLTSISIAPAQPSIAAGQSSQLTATGNFSDGSSVDLTAQVSWASSNAQVATASNASGSRGLLTGVATGSATIGAQLGSVSASVSATVTAAVLTGVQVTPGSLSLPSGQTGQLTATGVYSDGSTADLTAQVTWMSSATATATVSNAGVVAAQAVGSASITAQTGGFTGSAAITVTAATLQQLQVGPATASLPLGTTVQLAATAIYSDGTHVDATASATWTSSATAVATVSNVSGSAGLVSSHATGSATITAGFGGATATAAITVTTAQLVEIQLTPSAPSLPAGTTATMVATGVYSDGASHDITSQVTWTSSAPSTVGVSAGTLTAGAPGSATITAQLGSVSATAAVTITAAVLTSISIAPPHPTVVIGRSTQLTATGAYSDGTSHDVTAQALWSSSDTTIATVSNASGTHGQVTGAGSGSATITAQIDSVSFAVTVAVSPAVLVSLQITPATLSLPAGLSAALTVIGSYNDGTTLDLSSQATWTTSAPSKVAVSATGSVSALAAGSATVTAQVDSVSAQVTVTVTAAVLQTIAIAPLTLDLPLGVVRQLTATGVYSDGSHADLTASATWTSSANAVVTVSSAAGTAGQATGHATGSATVTATLGSVSSTASVNVTPAVLAQIQFTPATLTLPSGVSASLVATGVYSDGTTHDLTAQASWTSSAPSTASVTAGTVTAGTPGSATITAQVGSVTGSVTATVTAAVLGEIAIDPPHPAIVGGQSIQLTATGTYSDNSTANITSQVVWSSSNAQVAAVSNASGSQGTLTAVAAGTATITAALDGATTSVTVTVSPAVLTSLQISPAVLSLPRGLTAQLTATGSYSDGTTQDLSTQVTWTSSVPTTASVSTAGVVTGNAAGNTTITAALGSVTTQLGVTITPAVLTQLQLSSTSLTLPLGVSAQLSATGIYSDGSHADATASATWTSSAAAVAAVSNASGSAGRVSGASVGDTTITATLSGVSASVAVHVGAAALSSITITGVSSALPLGVSAQLTAWGTYSDGSTLDLTAQATWASSTGAASVSNAAGSRGVVSAAQLGQTVVSAAVDGVTGELSVTTTAASLVSIAVSSTPALPLGLTTQLTATGTYSDGNTADLTAQATWTSNAPSVVSVSHGLITSLGVGTAQIQASLGGATGTVSVSTTAASLVSITLAPASLSLPVGLVSPLVATGHYTDSSTLDLTAQVTWSSDAPGKATVSNTGIHGVVTALAVGTAHVTAQLGAISASATVTVTAAVITSVTTSPATLSLALGQIQPVTATAHFSDGSTSDITTQASWTSSATSTATVSNVTGSQGTTTAIAIGGSTLSATFQGVTATAPITVALGCHALINEVKTGTLLNLTNEFVEVFNPCSFSIDMSHERLVYRVALGLIDISLDTLTGSFGSGAYRVYAGSGFVGQVTGGLVSDLDVVGGGVALRDTTSGIIFDSMGYGTAINLFVEGVVSVALPTGSSLSRIPNGTDTNNNSNDFKVTPPTPGAANHL